MGCLCGSRSKVERRSRGGGPGERAVRFVETCGEGKWRAGMESRTEAISPVDGVRPHEFRRSAGRWGGGCHDPGRLGPTPGRVSEDRWVGGGSKVGKTGPARKIPV